MILILSVFEDTLKCLYLNGRCEQFCDGSGSRRRCYCADGYVLGDDGRHCVPNGRNVAGLPPLRASASLFLP